MVLYATHLMYLVYSSPSIKGHSPKYTSLIRTELFGSKYYECLYPLTKGHLSNKCQIIWWKGCPYWRGAAVYI